MEAIDWAESTPMSAIEVYEEDGRIVYERLTLRSPQDGRLLIKDLSISVPSGTRLLIAGSNETAKVALFRATAGIWNSGEGRIVRPGLDEILFLPERPYLFPSTLRKLLLRTGQEPLISDHRILATLGSLDLERVLVQAGGLDVEKDWDDILSLGEQQLLAFARLLLAGPQFAFLDRPGTAPGPGQVDQILKMLSDEKITYINIGETDSPSYFDELDYYDEILELAGDGGWEEIPIQSGEINEEGYQLIGSGDRF